MLYGIECHKDEIFKCSYDSPLQDYGYNYNKDFCEFSQKWRIRNY